MQPPNAADEPRRARATSGAILVTGLFHPLARRIASLASNEGSARVVYLLATPGELASARTLAEHASPDCRVEVLEGDPASMDLGLAGSEYRALAKHLDRIHHLAHSADTSLDAATLAELNVAAALEAVELARTSGRARLVFHSSVFAAPTDGGVAYERACRGDEASHDPLTNARRRAEAVAWRASRDCEVVVLRTGGVVPVPDRDRPLVPLATNANLLGLLLVLAQDPEAQNTSAAPFAALARGLASAPLHLAPLDFVARACLALGARHEVQVTPLHLVAPRPATAGDIARKLRQLWGPSRRVPLGKALLTPKLLESLARAPRAFVERVATTRRFDTHHAARLLEAEGLSWPDPESYVEHLAQMLESELGDWRSNPDTPPFPHA
jgi:nucleoside-diphosphate-sugar epimerase